MLFVILKNKKTRHKTKYDAYSQGFQNSIDIQFVFLFLALLIMKKMTTLEY